MMPSESERRFSDKEVKKLLARTVELTRQTESLPAHPDGITRSELERVAIDAGLPVEALRRAIAELDSPTATATSPFRRLLGCETYKIEQIIPRTFSRQELERLLMILPDIAGVPGSGSVTDDSLIWRSEYTTQNSSGIKRRIEITTRAEGGTSVSIEADPTLAAVAAYVSLVGTFGIGIGIGVAVPIGLAILHSPLFAVLVPIGSLVLTMLGARGIMSLVCSTIRRKAQRVIEEIVRRFKN
jgi:hypothetical protein